jgi:hypothetical protein
MKIEGPLKKERKTTQYYNQHFIYLLFPPKFLIKFY